MLHSIDMIAVSALLADNTLPVAMLFVAVLLLIVFIK